MGKNMENEVEIGGIERLYGRFREMGGPQDPNMNPKNTIP